MLAELMRFKWGIAIAGTHGKTTTTSIVSHILQDNNYDPTAIIGGIVNSWGNNSRVGSSNWLVAESDESDGSFLELQATISIITNIESEHMDHYKNYTNLEDHFIKFINQIPFYGFSVLCIDNIGVQNILPHVKKRRIITYGLSPQADYRAINIKYNSNGVHFEVMCQMKGKEKLMSNLYLPMYGDHNVLNSLAALIVAENIGILEDNIRNSISNFSGVKRRFTGIGEHNGIKFIDDYAHHPSEIEAVINSANQIVSYSGKIITIVQPHRYSRLKDQFDGFCKCFNKADIVFILDVYSAGEKPIDSYSGESLAKGIINYGHKNVLYIKDKEELLKILNI
jgi:UDP-N-acetylmuramate--alanine ligase